MMSVAVVWAMNEICHSPAPTDRPHAVPVIDAFVYSGTWLGQSRGKGLLGSTLKGSGAGRLRRILNREVDQRIAAVTGRLNDDSAHQTRVTDARKLHAGGPGRETGNLHLPRIFVELLLVERVDLVHRVTGLAQNA